MAGAGKDQNGGRDAAESLARHGARVLGAEYPEDVSFATADYVLVGDAGFEYHPAREILTVRVETGRAYATDAVPLRLRNLRNAVRGENDPNVGGLFERGGGYSLLDEHRREVVLVHDFPVQATGKREIREGTEYHVSLGATWAMLWGARVAGIVHKMYDEVLPKELVVWDDEVNALGAEVSRFRGRERADAIVRAYARHRLIRGAKLDRANRRDFGDFYFRYDEAGQTLTAAVFVATTKDLQTLAGQGVPEDRLRSALEDARVGGRFDRPPGGRFAWEGGAEDRMLYLAQSWPVAELTPRTLHANMETLLDFGVVWRHSRVFRVAAIAMGKEPAPATVVQRSPDEYGIAPARGSIVSAQPAAN